MNKEIKSEIEEYVLQEIKKLKNFNTQGKEYDEMANNSTDRIKTLVDLLQKEDVNNNDLYLQTKKIDNDEIKNNNESEIKKEELKIKSKVDVELKYDRWIKFGCETAKVVVPIIFYSKWMKRGFEFEETGSYTSSTFRNLFGRFKPE